jgi:hypothetical protein
MISKTTMLSMMVFLNLKINYFKLKLTLANNKIFRLFQIETLFLTSQTAVTLLPNAASVLSVNISYLHLQ